MERSSRTVRDDAKMERRTAGVTARCRFLPSTVLPVVVVPASLTEAPRNVGRGVSDDDEAILCLDYDQQIVRVENDACGFVLIFHLPPCDSNELRISSLR